MAASRGRPTIAFRVDQDIYRALRKHAEEQNLEWSEYLRQMACKHAEIDEKRPKKAIKRIKRRASTPKSGSNVPRSTKKRDPGDVEQPDMRFITWFVAQYATCLHAEYVPAWGRDRRIVRRLLSALDATELARRAATMLRSTDEFIVKTGRDLAVLERWINRFASNGRDARRTPAPKGFAGFAKPEQKRSLEDTEQPPP